MSYVTQEHVRRSLQYLTDHTHPLLITFFAMFRRDVPTTADANAAIAFGAKDERAVLDQYFKASPESSRPYYMPFGTPGTTRWRNSDYPGKALQRMRKDRPTLFRQNATDNKRWSLSPTFVASIKAEPEKYVGQLPVPLSYVACVALRQNMIADLSGATTQLAVDLKLNRNGLIPDVFSLEVPAELSAIALGTRQLTSAEVLEVFQEFEPDPSAVQPPDEPETQAESLTGSASAIVTGASAVGDWDTSLDQLLNGSDLQGVLEPATRALAALRAEMHVIFTGPPGCGKTSLAAQLCRAAGFESWTVPATDQWTTFDVIGGYFPNPSDDGSAGERLDFLPGNVVDSIIRGRCLIIDEINRADIDKAFGELLTLLSGYPVTLPYRRRETNGKFRRIQLHLSPIVDNDADTQPIVVPPWWRMIGTMNDSDKASLKRLSFAFVRRFAFIPIALPDNATYEALLRRWAAEFATNDQVRQRLAELVDVLVPLFCDDDTGFASVRSPFGPAIPKSMLRHAAAEWAVESTRPLNLVFRSVLESYVAPQLQGRADLHDKCYDLVRTTLASEGASFAHTLAVWTGHVDS